MKKFGFYVSGNAGRLKQLLTEYYIKELVPQIKVVITDNPKDLKLATICKNHSISFFSFDLSVFEKDNKNLQLSNFILDTFEQYQIDYGLSCGARIFKGEILKVYALRFVNFHPSILPAFKGLHAIDSAIATKSFLLGNTAHFIVEEVDSGPVIMQNIIHHSEATCEKVLHNQVVMIAQIMTWINTNRIEVKDGYVTVKKAQYDIACFIPNIEINT